jgi:adenosylcobinamide kinase/adenosylcobinamide-phosphate guanylyltransferase
MTVTLVLGGARSGKSRYAESLGAGFDGPRIYIATAQAFDAEMSARIEHHKASRGERWQTIESPFDLPEAVVNACRPGRFALVDCVTVWLGNLMHRQLAVSEKVTALCEAVGTAKSTLVLVSNEVGQGIVPDNAMARRFRDEQGIVNQRLAKIADEVVFVTAGIPVRLKQQA